jgi:hypothetical protein
MVSIVCPWCGQDRPLEPAELAAAEGSTCPECLTSVHLAEAPDRDPLPEAARGST